MKIEYRLWGKGIPPRPTKLQIPGWAGNHHGHDNGDTPQPWHCTPFVEASTYGLELVYPFDTEAVVYLDKNNNVKFEGDFTDECIWSNPPSPPFAAFAESHFGYTSAVDISVPEDHVVRLEPHPRFYTDTTGTCPCAISGHIQPWWCKIFFVVFKSPLPGQKIIFRKNEPYAQVLVVPKKMTYEIKEMDSEKAIERKSVENLINTYRQNICKHSWKDHKGNLFDDKYKQLLSIYNKVGFDGIKTYLEKIESSVKNKVKKKVKKIGKFVKR